MDTPLKAIRIKRGLVQQEVATAVGLSQGAYCRVENGDVVTSVDTAKKLAKFFGDAITVLEVLDPKSYTETAVGKAS
jgi:DNA-binding XRE family transcriptional regulator